MLKYIIIQRQDGWELPYIFPEFHQHVDFFPLVRQYPTDKVVAAGFARFGEEFPGGVKCGGESMTLQVKSRGQIDADLITKI